MTQIYREVWIGEKKDFLAAVSLVLVLFLGVFQNSKAADIHFITTADDVNASQSTAGSSDEDFDNDQDFEEDLDSIDPSQMNEEDRPAVNGGN